LRVLARGITKYGRTISFKFNGRSLSGVEGDSVASALINNGVHGFRGTEAAEERGLFCGMGVCNECLIQIDGEQGLLACMTSLEDQMDIMVQPQHKSKPDFELDVQINSLPEVELKTQVLVIGAGPAGMTIASKLAKYGVDVLVIDERKISGGQYFKQPAQKFEIVENKLDFQYRKGRALINDLDKSGAKIMHGVKIWAADGSEKFFAYDDCNKYFISTNKVVIATGAFEKGLAFPGWTLPGVMTTGAGQSLLRSYQVAPGEAIAIAGNGPLNLQLAAELLRAGAKVKVVAETASLFNFKNVIRGFFLFISSPRTALNGLGYVATIFKSGTKILTGQVIIEALGAEMVQGAKFAPIDSQGKPKSDPKNISNFQVDSVTIGYGFSPSNEIARILDCHHNIDEKWGYLTTTRDLMGATNLSNVWVIGDGSGINGAQVAKSNASLLALEMLRLAKIKKGLLLKLQMQLATFTLKNQLFFQKTLWKVFNAPLIVDQVATPETYICRCLSISLTQAKSAISEHTLSAGAAKRINRVGMGRCQGRYCSPVIQKLISENTGSELNQFSGFAPQVPIKPVPIGVIAQLDRETIK